MTIAVTSQNRRGITEHAAHPLVGVDVLIAGGMGSGLQARLARTPVSTTIMITTEAAVAAAATIARNDPAP